MNQIPRRNNYQFFEGVTAADLEVTLEEYTSGQIPAWTVKAMGSNESGYWILFEAVL